MSRYLINYQVRIEKISHHIPARSSSSGSSYFNPLTEVMSYALQEVFRHFYWPALGGDVCFVDDFALFVYQSVFGCCGADINSQISLGFFSKDLILDLIGTLKESLF